MWNDGRGINRYIMECKFDDLGSLAGEYIELIDTLWNVNQFKRNRISNEKEN